MPVFPDGQHVDNRQDEEGEYNCPKKDKPYAVPNCVFPDGLVVILQHRSLVQPGETCGRHLDDNLVDLRIGQCHRIELCLRHGMNARNIIRNTAALCGKHAVYENAIGTAEVRDKNRNGIGMAQPVQDKPIAGITVCRKPHPVYFMPGPVTGDIDEEIGLLCSLSFRDYQMFPVKSHLPSSTTVRAGEAICKSIFPSVASGAPVRLW